MSQKRLHVLGASGKMMSGLAVIAQQLGFHVINYDLQFAPPMSVQLKALNMTCIDDWDTDYLKPGEDVLVGNICRFDADIIRHARRLGCRLWSGPEWLYYHVISQRKVIAITGTHGKTTTASWCVNLAQRLGEDVGFLIGGIAHGLQVSASLGSSPWFVIEADEYDTAFFDKRPKFLHYWPHWVLVNNLDYDHADIYPDMDSIVKQYHFLRRIVHPDGGMIGELEAMAKIDAEAVSFSLHASADYSGYYQEGQLHIHGGPVIDVWGEHNAHNLLAIYSLFHRLGWQPTSSMLQQLQLPKRRLEFKGTFLGQDWFDDFAHHPCAMAKIVDSLRERYQTFALVICPTTATQRTREGFIAMCEALASVKSVAILLPKRQADWTETDVPVHWHTIIDEDQLLIWLRNQQLQAVVTLGALEYAALWQKVFQDISS